MKILQLFSAYLQYGGEEGSVKRIADHLEDHHHVDRFYVSTKDLVPDKLAGKLTLPLKVFHNKKIVEEIRARQAAENYDFWLIHNVFVALSPAVYDLAYELGVPIVHYLHNYRFGCSNANLFINGAECQRCIGGNFLPGVIRRCWRDSLPQTAMMAGMLSVTRKKGLFEKVAKWIALSEAQKEIHVRMGIPAENIDVVHHFFDKKFEEVPESKNEQNEALFIGRLSAEKGVDHLLRAWAKLPRDKKLIIAGDGPEMRDLQALTKELQLGNVEFAGFVSGEAQQNLWNRAAFSIVPSVWQEPFGMVVLESWARSKAVVAYASGALKEIITDGIDGYLAHSGDVDDLAGKIGQAFDNPEKTKGMGTAGKARLQSYFNKERWQADIEKSLAIFEASRAIS